MHAPAPLQHIGLALGRTFPDLDAVLPIRLLGEGFRSIAVETAGGVVFRIPKHAAAADGYRNEVALLPYLRPYLPFPVPDPQWYEGPSADFPLGVIGYERVPGESFHPVWLTPANIGAFATDLARFLVALHHTPTDQIEAFGATHGGDDTEALSGLRTVVLPALRSVLTGEEHRSITAWWERLLADPRMHTYRPALRHGDLWYEHLLVDDARCRLVGVLDFEKAGIGDPAQDFATQLHLGEAFTAAVVRAYRTAGGMLDAHLLHRMRRRWELREFDGIAFAVQAHDEVEFADAIRKLRAGPILHGWSAADVTKGDDQ